MTNWKADPKVQEAIQNLTTMYLRNDWTMADERRNIDALCEAVASSGSPPSPSELPMHAWARCGQCAKIVHAIIGETPEEVQKRVRDFTTGA